jgi:ATP-dependent DNA helicase RecG
MRPEVLFHLFSNIDTLQGVGPRTRTHFERLTGTRLVDLLWHFPVGLIDRRSSPTIEECASGQIATIKVTIGSHKKAPNRRVPYRVYVHDDTGQMTLVFFHAREKYLLEQLPEGETRIISGKVDIFGKETQMTHPDYIVKEEDRDSLPQIEPVYPLTTGLSTKVMNKAVRGALEHLPTLPEWLDEAHLKQQKWPTWSDALSSVHAPKGEGKGEGDFSPDNPARLRLAYDELLASQLALMLVRKASKRFKGRSLKSTGKLKAKLLAALPYDLTGDQAKTLSEIEADMAGDLAMLRLIQGDVGSGKTIVAFGAMVNAVEAGTQAAMLAPTEILARQHFETLKPFADELGLSLDILTGRHKGKTRAEKLEKLANGELDMLVGTHALIQGDVIYKDLGLAVVDEQHRFGVHQRMALANKGGPNKGGNDGKTQPDVLVMTATPIPRTLTLTLYGDMDVSRIQEKPLGRLPITTSAVTLDRMSIVVDGVRRVLDKGDQVYWVCPLVEESETLDLAAAEDRYDDLKKIFGKKVGLVHGQMKSGDKDAVMEGFGKGDIQILVATTVIEVGVDVKNATIMVIEHAERFGLAQLHQLRGRIGRGTKQSNCVLLRPTKLTDTARARIKVMRDTEDGFVIAEEDLKLRGAGELLGTRQSGFPEFRVADLAFHGDLLTAARDDAMLVMDRDQGLKGKRGDALRVLLYLFERETAIKLLKSG